jgi:hypothetical protein
LSNYFKTKLKVMMMMGGGDELNLMEGKIHTDVYARPNAKTIGSMPSPQGSSSLEGFRTKI